jgi:ribosomal protein S18 acetylase RimI-like enzyme
MSLLLRFMREGEEDAVAALIRRLPRDIGLDVLPKVTGESLRKARGIAEVTVAQDAGLIIGVCLWTMTYSSWRAMTGIYVSDLYVLEHVRGRNIGEKLLRYTSSVAHARGAGFIKLEVDVGNAAARKFYLRHGFLHKPDDHFYILEPEAFETFKGRDA